jgi:hypothetical protein
MRNDADQHHEGKESEWNPKDKKEPWNIKEADGSVSRLLSSTFDVC